MKYIALLRGINVSGKRKVDMKKLKDLFESLEFANVKTYLNSGNVLFESKLKKETLMQKITKHIEKEFKLKIPILVKTKSEVKKIARSIPENWKYNSKEYTEIAYLFPEIDSKKTIEKLPIKKEFIDLKYIKGAIIWNIKKENYNKSHINYVFKLDIYNKMTIRNLNTTKFLTKD